MGRDYQEGKSQRIWPVGFVFSLPRQKQNKEFQAILEKYVGQYKDNQSKIKRRDAIRLFQQEAIQIGEKNQRCLECELRVKEQENKIACFRMELEELHQRTAQENQEIQRQTEEILQEISHLEYEKLSEEYYILEEKKKFHASNREMIGMEKEGLEREADQIARKLHVLACAKQQGIVDEEHAEWERACQRLAGPESARKICSQSAIAWAIYCAIIIRRVWREQRKS